MGQAAGWRRVHLVHCPQGDSQEGDTQSPSAPMSCLPYQGFSQVCLIGIPGADQIHRASVLGQLFQDLKKRSFGPLHHIHNFRKSAVVIQCGMHPMSTKTTDHKRHETKLQAITIA